MAISSASSSRFKFGFRLGGKQLKRPYGLCVKMSAVAVLGLCFLFVLSTFSPSSSSLTSQRSSFSNDIAEPVAASSSHTPNTRNPQHQHQDRDPQKPHKDIHKHNTKKMNQLQAPPKHQPTVSVSPPPAPPAQPQHQGEPDDLLDKEKQGDQDELDQDKDPDDNTNVVDAENSDKDPNASLEDGEEDPQLQPEDDDTDDDHKSDDSEKVRAKAKGHTRRYPGPVFNTQTHYTWKMCSVRSKYNYIPCIDIESATGKLQLYRHHERSCPRSPPMCLVPFPSKGYQSPVQWPESKLKILYENVKHPKLSSFIKTKTWVTQSGEYLSFPQNQSEFKGGVNHYIDSIEEMVPDIEWGKNIRLILDVGCTDSSFGAALIDREVLTLTLGLKDDLVDLAQVALERGFAAIVSPFRARRLPFPSGVFEIIHCGGCSIPWHSNGGKLLLEMNRILRPGGYFILSTKHDNIEQEEAMSTLIASLCWNILAHKTDEISDMGVKIYQKPEANDIYRLRRRKTPPMCKEDDNPDATWYVPIRTCLHSIPSSIEQRGTEWPEEWPQRLQSYPEWLSSKENVIADTEHWKSIVEKSYLIGMGINWSKVRNIMDMKAIYGGFAAALVPHNVWVMNVVPIHAPDTLPVIYERGLVGIYHDWCESFGTYPRTYDLLHADHLFSRLKNRCKQPVGIVVEMDRILRPGGWAIIRDKVEILDPLEVILRSLHWEIRMTYAKDKQGIICAQKTGWRP